MEVVNQIFSFISKLFEWWFTVMPWEQAIFIRKGKNPKILKEGLYFKIPFIDRVYIQQTRTRIIDVPVQTVSTSDNKTITIRSVIGYSITDLLVLFNTISHPEMTLQGIVMGAIADHINQTNSEKITPSSVEEYALTQININNYGLGNVTIKITSWAEVKTYRLIQDHSWINEGLNLKYLGEK